MDFTMDVSKPIFIIGTGRCGTTLLLNTFAAHPELAWFSNYANRYPDRPELASLSRLAGVPLLGDLFGKSKYFPCPLESYRIWDSCYRGFSEPFRDLDADDVTPYSKERIRHVVGAHMRYQKKDRFITKYTGWSRIGYLNEVFPDAIFIHLLRDGRAVANSLLRTSYFRGWRGDQGWRWGILSDDLRRAWIQSGKSFITLAGLQWKILVNNIDEKSKILGDESFIEVKYEELTEKPYETMKRLSDFCGLRWCGSFANSIKSREYRNMNYQWLEDLHPKQQKMLEEVIEDELRIKEYL